MALLDLKQRASRQSLGLFAATLAPFLYGIVLAAPVGGLGSALPVLVGSLGEGPGSLSSPAALVGKLFTLLPIGPLSLRVALASTCAMALCLHLLYRNIEILLRALGVTHDVLIAPVALGMCLLVFGMPVVLHAALWPSAFALQAALGLAFLLQLSKLEASFPSYDLRPLGTAALFLGLSVANDARAGLVLLPAALPTLSRVLHAKGLSPLLRALAVLVVAALATATAFTLRDFVHPDALSHARPLRAGSLPSLLTLLTRAGHALSWFGVLAGLGAVAALQTPGVRRLATIWVYACLAPLLAYGLLSPAPVVDEGLGLVTYVLPAAAVLAAALPGALLSPDGRSKPVPSRAQLAAVCCLLLIGGVRAHDGALTSQATTHQLVSTWSARGYAELPAGALVLVHDPDTLLPLMAASAADHLRPDVRLLPVAVLDHGPSAEHVLRALPELKPLLRSYLLEGELGIAELESLAGRRPILLDMDPTLSPKLYGSLRPLHLFYEVSGAASRRAEERSLARALQDDLDGLLSAAPKPDTASRRALAAHALAAGLYFAASGNRPSARAAIATGKQVCPSLAAWDLLGTALGHDDEAREPVAVDDLMPHDLAEIACVSP